MADASIFAQYLKPPKSIAEYQDEGDQRTLSQLKLLLGQQEAQQKQQGFADEQVFRGLASQFGNDQKALAREAMGKGLYKQAQSIESTIADLAAKQAKTNMDAAHAKNFDANTGKTAEETKYLKATRHAQNVVNVQSPQDVVGYIDQGVQEGIFPAEMRDQMLQKASSYPTIDAWKQAQTQGAIPVLERFKTDAENSRNALTNKTSADNNAATQATSRANNSATVAEQARHHNMVNARSVDALNGAESAFTPEAIKNAAARYNIDGTLPPMGMGKTGSLGRAAILNEAATQASGVSPDDQRRGQIANKADFAANQRTLGAFSSGKEAQSVRAFGVALSHLDTLSELSDALKNGDIKVINRVGNLVAEQTGKPAPTNFAAAKRIVADEIVKSVTGAAGALGDRETADKTLNAANSPEQLKGVIATYKKLMDGQLGGLRNQYKAGTGRDDFDKKFNIKPGTEQKNLPTGWTVKER
jgi:hypothetical protein